MVWVGGVAIVLALVVALVVRRNSGDEQQPAVATVAAVVATSTRAAAIDQRLAAQDGASETDEYTRLLDSLQDKLHQSGDAIAACTETGVRDLTLGGVPTSNLEMLTRMDSLVKPQPANQPRGVALTCRDVARLIVGAGR